VVVRGAQLLLSEEPVPAQERERRLTGCRPSFAFGVTPAWFGLAVALTGFGVLRMTGRARRLPRFAGPGRDPDRSTAGMRLLSAGHRPVEQAIAGWQV
jgi:hypothetical protein